MPFHGTSGRWPARAPPGCAFPSVGQALRQSGYRFVDIFEAALDGGQSVLFLHVEKREMHTVASLYERNDELYRLAEQLGLESYDGMDVGPAESGPDA